MPPPADPLLRLHGDPRERSALTQQLATVLTSAAPGSEVRLGGSLASGTADAYSDIDLVWLVPKRLFGPAIGCVVSAVSVVAPVASFRSDPEHQLSPRRRLLFIRFAGVPLFWRLDLEVTTVSTSVDDAVDATPHGHGREWCEFESAVMNALGALKAHLRGRAPVAEELLTRAFDRLGLDPRTALPTPQRVSALAEAIVRARPHLRPLAEDVALVARALH